MRTTLFLFLFCLLCSSQACLAAYVLKAGQNITGNASSLASVSGAFKLGFFSLPKNPTKSYLGIWYNQTQYSGKQKVVVWVANRDNPVVGSHGVFHIAQDGNLVVTNTSGGILWSSQLKASSSRNSRTVKLLDTGNLVLMDDLHGTGYIWQSFQHPTDTFLPGMEMVKTLELTCWRDENDPGSGNFTFKMSQTEQNRYVILQNQHQLHWENNELNPDALSPDKLNYFTNFTSDSSSVKQAIIKSSNKTMSVNFSNTARNWESWYGKFSNTRFVMNYTGEIQFLKWETENPEWFVLWKQPSDICDIYNYCGNFSSCNSDDLMKCKCLPGFSPIVESNQLYDQGAQFPGCVRKSTLFDNNNNKDLVFLNLTMIRVGIADIRFAADTEEECQSFCLTMPHPRCQDYKYNSSSSYSEYTRGSLTCGIWRQDLTTLRVANDGDDDASDLSILVKSSDIAPSARSCKPCGIYSIPYPLSTGPNCGDPMYNNFSCDYSTGQLSFRMPRGESYRVTWIDEISRKFYIQTSDSLRCYLYPNQHHIFEPGSAFEVTEWCFRENFVEIRWVPAPEPLCYKNADCNDWPNSTCETREGKRMCLCNSNYVECYKSNLYTRRKIKKPVALDSHASFDSHDFSSMHINICFCLEKQNSP